MACSGCQKLPCPRLLALPYRETYGVHRIMKIHGQGNFWWMVWGGKRRKKKHDQTILVERADRLQRSCTSEKAFLLIFPCHMPRKQHVLYVCAFSSPGKHCSAHWGASKLGHGVRQKPPFGWPLRWRFPLPYHSLPFPTMPLSTPFAHFGHLYCNPQAPNSPSGLSNVYVFSLALQLSLGDHPLSRGSKSGRVSHLKWWWVGFFLFLDLLRTYPPPCFPFPPPPGPQPLLLDAPPRIQTRLQAQARHGRSWTCPWRGAATPSAPHKLWSTPLHGPAPSAPPHRPKQRTHSHQ